MKLKCDEQIATDLPNIADATSSVYTWILKVLDCETRDSVHLKCFPFSKHLSWQTSWLFIRLLYDNMLDVTNTLRQIVCKLSSFWFEKATKGGWRTS